MDNEMITESNKNILDNPNKVTDIISVRELLNANHVFRIPDYQRGYAWDKEFLALWKDIVRLYRAGIENRKHYTGMLALEEIKADTTKEQECILGTNAFYIVDGQQRITSLIIILKFLVDYLDEEEEDFNRANYTSLLKTEDDVDKFGYSVNRTDGLQEYFYERVLNNNTKERCINQYRANINNACVYIEKELLKFDAQEALSILELILDKIVFNLYFVTDSFDVRVTFETMNNRGKKLSKLELLKNRLMYLSTFLNGNYPTRLKKNINDAWKDIYENLSFGDFQMSDDEYLKAHWIVYKRLNKRKGDAFIDDILDNEFTVDSGEFHRLLSEKDNKGAFAYLDGYISSLKSYSKYWAYVNNQKEVLVNIDEREAKWIKRFGRLTNSLFVRSTLMVVLAENDLDIPSKEDFYSIFERFIFVNKLLAQDKNDLSFIVTYARDLMNAKMGDKVSCFEEMKKQIKRHDLNITPKRVQSAMEAFQVYITSRGKYYYDWSGLNYFLYEYNESLQIASAAPIEWYNLNNVSVEHVFPQTPEKEYWKVAFETYLDGERQTGITNSLGNLLLLSSTSENSSLKNYSYPVKREMSIVSGRFAYRDGSRSAREIAQNSHWTPKHIYDRTKKLFDFIYEHWFSEVEGFERNNWNQLVDRLNLYNFDYAPLSEEKQKDLEIKLSKIDTKNERGELENLVNSRRDPDYHQKQILEYFDPDVISITYNKSRIFYGDYFSFKITKDKMGELELFRCGILDNQKYIRFSYYYKSNEFYVEDVSLEPYYQYSQGEINNEKIKRFIRSFFRYIRKQYGRGPIWISKAEPKV